MQYSARLQGILLLVFSALVFSSAGLFAKGIQADSWDIIFWRGVFATAFTTVFIFWNGNARREFVKMGWSGWIAGAIGALGTAAFIPAFKLTTIANVSLIYAVAPLLAGLMAWVWLSERMTKVVIIGCVLAFAGVLIIVGGSLGSINLKGDLLALWMTIAMSFMMVIYRRYPDTPAAGPAVMSSLLLLPPALILGDPFANSWGDIAMMAVFGLVFALASVTLLEGVRRLPASEAALLSTLEAPFAPVLAWLVLMELPSMPTVIGGIVILAGVVGSQLFSQRELTIRTP